VRKLMMAGNPLSNPFPGLRPFECTETHLFFGREAQKRDVIRRLSRNHFLAVVGDSGTGKSSLVRAGLLPVLQAGLLSSAGSEWRIAILQPGNDPIGNLAKALIQASAPISDADEVEEALVEAGLRRSSLGLLETARSRLGWQKRPQLAQKTSRSNLLVVVDQFEELFTQKGLGGGTPGEEDSVLFVNLLLRVLEQGADRIYILLTMRSTFLGDCWQFHGLPEVLTDHQYLVPRMTRDEQREAITGPVAVAGGQITGPLVNQLLNDAGNSQDQLPILQHALMRTWDHWIKRHNGTGQLDINHYLEIGGMAGALSRHADEAYTELDERGRKIAEAMFKRLTRRRPDNQDVRDPVELRELQEVVGADGRDVELVINAFRGVGRLFLLPAPAVPLEPGSVINISHESLIRNWDRLRKWSDEEAESGEIYSRLAETALLYNAGKEALYRAPALQNALFWRERAKPSLLWARRYHPAFQPAMDFLDRSQRRYLTRRLLLLLVVSAAFLATAILTTYAFRQRRIADERRIQTEVLSYVANVRAAQQAVAGANYDLATELLDNCLPKVGERDRRQFEWYYLSGHGIFTIDAGEPVRAAAFSPDGARVVIGGDGPIGQIWDTSSGLELVTLKGHEYALTCVAFSPDGQMVATASRDKTARLWDPHSGESLSILSGHQGVVTSVAFSPDGTRVATGSYDNTARIWDRASGGEVRVLWGHTESVLSVAFSADGKRLVTGSADRTARVWDLDSGQCLTTLEGHQDGVSSAKFSPKGSQIATGSYDGRVMIWEAASGRRVSALDGHQGLVLSVAFSLDGSRLLSSTDNNTAQLWDVNLSQELGALSGHQDLVASAQFALDGRKVLTASADHTVRIWEAQPSRELITLKASGTALFSAVFSPDATRIATAGADQVARIYDASSREVLASLTGHEADIRSVTFSPNGESVVTASSDGTARVWDPVSGRQIAKLNVNQVSVRCVAFSPNGNRIITGGGDNLANVFEVATGRELLVIRGHSSYVSSAGFSPDGEKVITGSGDHTARVWSMKSGRQLLMLQGHDGPVLAVAFSPDGNNGVLIGVVYTRREESSERRYRRRCEDMGCSLGNILKLIFQTE
jgi:WD40 repeat protein